MSGEPSVAIELVTFVSPRLYRRLTEYYAGRTRRIDRARYNRHRVALAHVKRRWRRRNRINATSFFGIDRTTSTMEATWRPRP